MTSADRRWAALSVGLVLVLRLPWVATLSWPDEAGYLMVARQWRPWDAQPLYGHYWVDRPPLLLLLFKAAGGVVGLRVLGIMACLLLVAAATSAGRSLAGGRGGRRAGLAAAALGSAYGIGALEVDGELLAAPLVMGAIALTLRAVEDRRSDPGRVLLGAGAGIAGAAAVLVKQNIVDGLAFAGVLLVLSTFHRHLRAGSWRVLGGWAAGILLAAASVTAWAGLRGPGVASLGYAMWGFRFDAAEVMATEDMSRPALRLALLLLVGLVSGLLPLLTLGVLEVAPVLRHRDPLGWAYLGLVGAGAAGVAAGGSYWLHYLIQLVPAALVAVALCSRRTRPRRPLPGLLALTVAFSLVGQGAAEAAQVVPGEVHDTRAVAGWLRRHSDPGQAVVVLYGQPNIVDEAGLTCPYPYLWSLPTRVRDPHLTLLRSTLAGPRAPEWVVAWHDPDSWDLDRHGRLAALLARDYRRAATVGGRPVYHRVAAGSGRDRPAAH